MTTCAPPADSDLDPVRTGIDPPASTGSHHPPDATGPTSRLHRRLWPAVASLTVMVTGVLYMLAWGPLVLHRPMWMTGGDLWGIFRGAHYIAWGYLPGVYASANGVVSFPGMEVLLAPVAMVTSSLHLTESYGPFFVPRPTAALLVQPVELLTAGAVTFAVDALAERLRAGHPRRIALCFAAAAVAWPVAALWGHGEDLLALTFGIYALIAAVDGRWRRAGWLLGLGIAFQPLVALIVPLLIGASPRGQRLMLAVRSAALSVFLVGVAFVGNPADTLRAVVTQPTPPAVNHATPWVAFAPTVSSGATSGGSILSVVRHGTGLALHTAQTTIGRLEVVSGGAGRTIDVVLALLFGLYAASPAGAGPAALAGGRGTGQPVLLRGRHDAVLPGATAHPGPGPGRAPGPEALRGGRHPGR